eukprot:4616209-Ditylum_brightwellii.AAC.1
MVPLAHHIDSSSRRWTHTQASDGPRPVLASPGSGEATAEPPSAPRRADDDTGRSWEGPGGSWGVAVLAMSKLA